jgi:hypothetical protein
MSRATIAARDVEITEVMQTSKRQLPDSLGPDEFDRLELNGLKFSLQRMTAAKPDVIVIPREGVGLPAELRRSNCELFDELFGADVPAAMFRGLFSAAEPR